MAKKKAVRGLARRVHPAEMIRTMFHNVARRDEAQRFMRWPSPDYVLGLPAMGEARDARLHNRLGSWSEY